MNDKPVVNSKGLTAVESRAVFSLAGIFSLRMIGLFMILPVFALYAEKLAGVTPVLIGLAIGAYGLSQALLQIPFGMLSDRIGRKPVIIGGLILFAIGSIIAAMADSIWGVIIGRIIQGSGAIAAAVMALAADLTREQNRTKAMAVIGMSIGIAFVLALVLGPLLNSWIGIPGIFWLTALLALCGVLMALFLVPDPQESHFHRDTETVPGMFGRVLTNPNLLRLDVGILLLHMGMTALFLAIPLALRDVIGLESKHHWWLYLSVLVVSVVLMVPLVAIAENRRKMKQIFLSMILALVVAQLGFVSLNHSLWGVVLSLIIYFTAFNVLEAALPSLVAKIAPADCKGTALGVYSTSQFAGAFAGGLLGGWMHALYGLEGVFFFNAVAMGLWFLAAYGMNQPEFLHNHLLKVGRMDEIKAYQLQQRLLAVEGVNDATVIADDAVAYLKIDPKLIDYAALDEFNSEQG